ncbi:MAG: diadenylate cyclase CdaA [Desulfovibrionaceae bacterium]|nr:diadenylate cyclase CdaA [Desulfovibrionaceae bacterium]
MQFLSENWREIIDFILVSFLFYQVIVRIRGTRALPAVYGLVALILIYFFSRELGFYTLQWLLENFLGSLFIIIIVLFQRDIREILTAMGLNRLNFPFFKRRKIPNEEIVNELAAAARQMSHDRIGALIVIERRSPLGDILRGGVTVDAKITRALLVSIFFPKTPLHDGAVVIARGRVAAAGCILPLTAQQNMSNDRGTRHRAAMGVTEESDALVVVISEERGTISIAENGKLMVSPSEMHLRRVLEVALDI